MTNMDSLKNDLDNFDLNENDDNYDDCDENNRLTQPSLSYKERKIEHKLKKYEAILRNLENINRVTESSKVRNYCNIHNTRNFQLFFYLSFSSLEIAVLKIT